MSLYHLKFLLASIFNAPLRASTEPEKSNSPPTVQSPSPSLTTESVPTPFVTEVATQPEASPPRMSSFFPVAAEVNPLHLRAAEPLEKRPEPFTATVRPVTVTASSPTYFIVATVLSPAAVNVPSPSRYAYPTALALSNGEVDYAIVVCFTGIGVSMVANKVKGVRCSLVTTVEDAVLTKEHNDSNCLALGAKNVSFELAKDIVDAWMSAEFVGGRHLNRVNKIKVVEEE